MNLSDDLVCLNAFFDALQTRRACEFLEEDGIGFEVRDRSMRVQGVGKFHEGPAILMEIFVNADDVQRAQSCLRRTMQLFPEREIISTSNELCEEGEVLSEAFACDEQNDAVSASDALSEAGIWSTFRKETDEDGECFYMVEVKGGDIERAIVVVNRWLDSR
jgi:hypothetical protein